MSTSSTTQDQNGGKQYKQLKVSVDSVIALNFKDACIKSNVSMAVKLSELMAGFSDTIITHNSLPDYSTKRRRRDAIRKIIKQLVQIMDCEQAYMDRIPENLQNSVVYERAEEFIGSIETAIESLEMIN